MQNYPREDIYSFGTHLLESGDLDPVYIMLHRSGLDGVKRAKFLLAYFSYYHVGAACFMTDSEDFWLQMQTAAENVELTPLGTRWPRGHERRHARGASGVKMVSELGIRYADQEETFLQYVSCYEAEQKYRPPVLFRHVAERVKEHHLFGDWIAFKIADVLDRLGIQAVDFDQAAVFMFKDPAKAAGMLYRDYAKLPANVEVKLDVVIPSVVAHLTYYFKDFKAPPLGDRPVGLQEVETILCKWKSHVNGHYPRFNDITEIRNGLQDWSKYSETARMMLASLPKGEA